MEYQQYHNFDRERAIRHGEIVMDHAMDLIKGLFQKYKRSLDMPVEFEHAICMLSRNMITFALYRYIKPQFIQIDYFDLMMTPKSRAFLQGYVCPCGKICSDFARHYRFCMYKNQASDHSWFYEVY
jgi:hypothetical protein